MNLNDVFKVLRRTVSGLRRSGLRGDNYQLPHEARSMALDYEAGMHREAMKAVKDYSKHIKSITAASVELGAWLSPVLDDPNPCEEHKQAIRNWFEAMEQLPEYRAAFDFDNPGNVK